MKYLQRKSLLAVSAAAMVFGLAACDRADDPTVGSADSASTRSERAANETQRDTRSATAEARRDARDATASAGSSMDRAAESTRSMGAAGADKTREMGAAAGDKSRDMAAATGDKTREMGAATGDKVDDATITTKVNAALASDSDLSAIRIDVDTKDGVVTLSGPAPNATAKEKASQIARNVKGVSSVNNQLTVSAS